MIPRWLKLAAPALAALACCRAADKPPAIPQGLPPLSWPQANPYSAAKVELGRILYFDRRLSAEAGFAHHVVKPVDPSDLAALLERDSAASPP